MNHTTWSALNRLLELHNIVVSRLRLGFSQCRALSWYLLWDICDISSHWTVSASKCRDWWIGRTGKLYLKSHLHSMLLLLFHWNFRKFVRKQRMEPEIVRRFCLCASSYLMLPAKNTCPQNEVIEKFVLTSCVWVRVANELTLMHAFLFACFLAISRVWKALSNKIRWVWLLIMAFWTVFVRTIPAIGVRSQIWRVWSRLSATAMDLNYWTHSFESQSMLYWSRALKVTGKVNALITRIALNQIPFCEF